MNKHLAPVLAVVAALGVVGGVAASQAFKPIDKPEQSRVQLVQPAADTVTVEPTPSPTTTATVAPKPVAKPKPVATVESTQSTTQQRQAIVSEPAPETSTQEPAPNPTPVTGPPPRQGGNGGNYVCSPTGCVTQEP